MNLYENTILLIEEAVLSRPYFCFLLGDTSDVNQQFDTKECFPLGFLYYPNIQVSLVQYNENETFSISLELIDLDEVEGSTEVTKYSVVSRMYEEAKEVIGYLNQYGQGQELFRLSNITITPLSRVRTNNRVTSGVRLDFSFAPEPEFSQCYL